MGDFEDVSVDVFSSFRDTLVDGLVDGKWSWMTSWIRRVGDWPSSRSTAYLTPSVTPSKTHSPPGPETLGCFLRW
ncbi:MAG: hypothetical protein MZU84_03245 [Sphingobacterium sp.]|nr:hypothetical protein [Sphingobacterium sp.]